MEPLGTGSRSESRKLGARIPGVCPQQLPLTHMGILNKLFNPYLILRIYEMPGVIIHPLPHSHLVRLNCSVSTWKASAERHYSTHEFKYHYYT